MDANRRTILIVDDEPRTGSIYTRMLVEEGFIARFAPGAREATNILIREKVEVVLLDINMPGINGSTVDEIIQEYDPSIKVIIVSSYPINLQKKLFPQAFDYHDKAENHSCLLQKVMRAVEEDEAVH